MPASAQFIEDHFDEAIEETNLSVGKKIQSGKVRDTYEIAGERVIVTTDRQSAFDLILAAVPFKGQVLNRISNFWFQQTKDIVPNHILAMPDPAVSVVKQATVFPVEIVVRGYITGTTNTSAWVNYKNGVREFCGVTLPDGLKKNQKFAKPIITPTTKPETGHDESVTPEQIVERGYMTPEEMEYIFQKALEVFARGTEIAAKNGFILVDTKYEFGKDEAGNILLVDEVHTPDSSRYWQVVTYEERFAAGEEPEAFDKEFLRLWFTQHCDPYNDPELPAAPRELVVELSRRYMEAFEVITGEEFVPELGGEQRIEGKLKKYFKL